MSSFVGGPINDEVIKQVKTREDILSRRSPENFLQLVQGSNAWIRVISGVDIGERIVNNPSNGAIGPTQDEIVYTSNKAQNNVLSGGELVWDGSKFLKRSSFNTGPGERGKYNYTEAFGIRPEGGITGFSIQHKNRFGTVREAIINFTVWTKEDLQTAENLYFRPGMTLLTEWGNSSYFTNDKNYVDVVTTNGVNDFFNNGQTVNQEKILKILTKNITESAYNYDAFFGFISNFSWNLREDGGFDCTLTVLSRGSILDSLSVIKGTGTSNGPFGKFEEKFFSIAKPPPSKESEAEEEPGFIAKVYNKAIGQHLDDFADWVVNGVTYADTELEESQRLSLMHFFCLKVEEIDIEDLDEGYITFENFKSPVYKVIEGQSTGTQEVEGRGTANKKVELNPIVKELENEFTKQEVFFSPSTMLAAGFNGKTTGEGKTAFRYISIRTFLALVNLSFLNGSDQNLPSFTLNSTKQYETFDNHFSFDPSSVLLPKSPSQPELKASRRAIRLLSEIPDEAESLRQGTATRTLERQSDKEPYTKVILNDTSNNIEKESVNDPKQINNIYISTKLIKENLDLLFTSGTSELDSLNVLAFVKNILSSVNNHLGGINELDVHYDEINDKISVVDRVKLIDDSLDKKQIPVINISGLPNTVKAVNMQTKVASNLASMISISATAGTEDNPNNNPGLTEYNNGKRDRFKNNSKSSGTQTGESDQPKTAKEKQEEEEAKKDDVVDKAEKREKFFLNLFQAYTKFNNLKFFDLRTKGVYNEKKFDKLKGEKISRTKEALAKDLKSKDTAPANIIPIELSLTVNGISGLIVGQVFKIEGTFLPDIYKDTGFIITSLDANIEENKWYTTIKAQTFMLNRISSSGGSTNEGGKY